MRESPAVDYVGFGVIAHARAAVGVGGQRGDAGVAWLDSNGTGFAEPLDRKSTRLNSSHT